MAQINDTQIEVWIVEGENGQVLFDSPPSERDVLSACADLKRPLTIFAVTCIPIQVEQMFTLDDR